MNGEDLNRLSTTLSSMIRQQAGQIEKGLHSLSTALDQAAARLAAIVPGAAGNVAGGPAAVTPAPAPGTALSLVRIVNDNSQPLPVRIVAGLSEQRPQGGLLSGILGGVGALAGGFLGGLFGGGVGMVALAVAVGELVPVLIEVIILLNQVRNFFRETYTSLIGLVDKIFGELTAAGILPVSRLVASLLVLIDVAVRIVLTYITPLLNWVNGLLQGLFTWMRALISRLTVWVGQLADWLVKFIDAMFSWLSSALPILVVFLRDSANFIIDSVIRPAIQNLLRDIIQNMATIFVGFLTALPAAVIAAGEWLVDKFVFEMTNLLNGLITAINRALSLLPGGPSIPTLPLGPSPGPVSGAVDRAIRDAFASSRALGQFIAGELVPAFAPTAAAPSLALPRVVAPPRPGLVGAPELTVPEYKPPGPAMEDLLRLREGPSAELPVAPSAAGAAPTGATPINLEGGIHVQIAAETIDRDHAEATARIIAEQVLEEIRRRVEMERFRRGLTTAAIA